MASTAARRVYGTTLALILRPVVELSVLETLTSKEREMSRVESLTLLYRIKENKSAKVTGCLLCLVPV